MMKSAGLDPYARRFHAPLPGAAGHGVLARFLLAAVFNTFLIAALAQWIIPAATTAGAVLAMALFAGGVVWAAIALHRTYPHPRLGTCNVITQTRAALTATLAVPLVAPGVLVAVPAMAWTMLAIAAVALLLDGCDGWLARRSGLGSAFGAAFDMEVDCVLALLLAVLAWQSGKAGLWVLALGVARYVFLAAGLAWPWLRAELPPRFSRKAVCVIQIGVLIVMLAPIVQPPVSTAIALLATGLVVWSFAADVLWLARNRP